MMLVPELIKTIEVQNTLGEGILWRESDETVWWTDIQEKKLYKLSWLNEDLNCFELPERLGSFGFVQNNEKKLICAFESGFALFEPETTDLHWLARPEELKSGVRLNDGRVAPDGSFWAGSMIEEPYNHGATTGLYCLSKGSARLVISGLGISNGLAWSPLGDEMYFSDSAQQLIFRSKYPPPPFKPTQQDVFAKTVSGAPDGAITDIAGRYWSAIWGEGCVRCFLPDSEVLMDLSVPALQPTCVAFGGKHRDLLFVTSAREGLNANNLKQSTHSGNVFVYKTDTYGSPPCRYML